MSAPRKPTGAAIDQHANGWGTECIVGSFESKMGFLFMLASLTMEAHSHVVPGALPMTVELAEMIYDLKAEFEAFLDVVGKEAAA